MRAIASRFADFLTVYRLAAAPVLAFMAMSGHRDAFFILLIISLATDLVDGPIARWAGHASAFGAKLDSMADGSTLIVGFFGLWLFERHTMQADVFWLYLFFATYAAAATTSLIKFRTLPAYHLYLSKTAASFSGPFVAWLYFVDYSRPFFIVLASIGVMANCESVLVTRRLKRFRADVGSLLFVEPGQR
ncbi:hypothetical protein GCM10009127_14060 [Alteraurantiacibacter aestuarii]|uniref:CDP-alcohol phosphatidyltransferase family protein n=1 Tax=Alteraurantiacibacter aestuarii TaxID=650004 RepID=A0A844ZKB4_9SPHN|nr:CDP-alcohol phosphatidyltransferase family protein [Alteraurantiacibacter aestuarii]MXO88004.1 hypothetical protein [Alteraurantiacibacter aestuarii]